MIEFNNVSKYFGPNICALSNITLTINENEFVFLIGPSGAGKSTLINLILASFLPTEGNIKIDELIITPKKKPNITRLRQKIGVIFQDFKLIETKTVYENIELGLKILKYPKEDISFEINRILKFVNLENKAKFFPQQLSAGEQQRVAIARALAGNRKYIIADEPTGNLDPKNSWKIMEIFAKLKGKKTIIIATHNFDIVDSFQERVVELKKGKIISDKKLGEYSL